MPKVRNTNKTHSQKPYDKSENIKITKKTKRKKLGENSTTKSVDSHAESEHTSESHNIPTSELASSSDTIQLDTLTSENMSPPEHIKSNNDNQDEQDKHTVANTELPHCSTQEHNAQEHNDEAANLAQNDNAQAQSESLKVIEPSNMHMSIQQIINTLSNNSDSSAYRSFTVHAYRLYYRQDEHTVRQRRLKECLQYIEQFTHEDDSNDIMHISLETNSIDISSVNTFVLGIARLYKCQHLRSSCCDACYIIQQCARYRPNVPCNYVVDAIINQKIPLQFMCVPMAALTLLVKNKQDIPRATIAHDGYIRLIRAHILPRTEYIHESTSIVTALFAQNAQMQALQENLTILSPEQQERHKLMRISQVNAQALEECRDHTRKVFLHRFCMHIKDALFAHMDDENVNEEAVHELFAQTKEDDNTRILIDREEMKRNVFERADQIAQLRYQFVRKQDKAECIAYKLSLSWPFLSFTSNELLSILVKSQYSMLHLGIDIIERRARHMARRACTAQALKKATTGYVIERLDFLRATQKEAIFTRGTVTQIMTGRKEYVTHMYRTLESIGDSKGSNIASKCLGMIEQYDFKSEHMTKVTLKQQTKILIDELSAYVMKMYGFAFASPDNGSKPRSGHSSYRSHSLRHIFEQAVVLDALDTSTQYSFYMLTDVFIETYEITLNILFNVWFHEVEASRMADVYSAQNIVKLIDMLNSIFLPKLYAILFSVNTYKANRLHKVCLYELQRLGLHTEDCGACHILNAGHQYAESDEIVCCISSRCLITSMYALCTLIHPASKLMELATTLLKSMHTKQQFISEITDKILSCKSLEPLNAVMLRKIKRIK